MKTWKITAPKTFELVDDNTILTKGFIKVKIKYTFFSSTDVMVYNNTADNIKYPITPCRMAVGVVSEVFSECAFEMGQRVVLTPYVDLSTNPMEKKEKIRKNIDVMGFNRNGFLADYVIVPLENVTALPEGISDTSALFIEYIAIASKTYDVLEMCKKQYVAILGGNIQGNILAQLSMYHQCIPILIDGDENKLNLAQDNGIYYTINSSKENVVRSVLEITGGQMADHCIYNYSDTQNVSDILKLTKKCGKIGIIGYAHDKIDMHVDMSPVLDNQLTIFGISNGYKEKLTAINLLQNKAILVDNFIGETVGLLDAPMEFKKFDSEYCRFKKTIVTC